MQDLVAPFKPTITQKVAYTGTHGVIANGTGAGVNVIRVWTSTLAYIAIGSAPSATTSGIPISAAVPQEFICPPGSKVSAIQDSAGGNLYVTELTK
jgi:hypothetical protein